VLSDLQLRVARIIAGLIEADDFALAGGAALIVRGEITRATRDLDFFGTSPDAVDRLVPAAELALQEAGLQVDRLIDRPGFTRFVVADQVERTELDLASDARLFPTEVGPGFDLLSSKELAADKVLAVFGELKRAIASISWPSSLALALSTSSNSRERRTAASLRSSSSRCWIAFHVFVEMNSRSTTSSSKT